MALRGTEDSTSARVYEDSTLRGTEAGVAHIAALLLEDGSFLLLETGDRTLEEY